MVGLGEEVTYKVDNIYYALTVLPYIAEESNNY